MANRDRNIQSVDTLYAGFCTRLIAMLIDLVILSVIGAILNWIGIIDTFNSSDTSEASGTGQLIQAIIFFGYFVLFTAYRGQTLGKMAVGIKVVDADGNKPGIVSAILREVVGKIVSAAILFVGFLLAAFDGRKRALHDRIGSTYVEKV